MNASLTTSYNIGRPEWLQTLEPEAGSLNLTVAELPGLEHLIRLAHLGADDRHGVFQRDHRNRRGEQSAHEIKRLLLDTRLTFGREMTSTRHRQMCARRMAHHQVPTITDDVKHVTSVVVTWHLSGKQIAGHGVMTASSKCITYPTGVLASNQDSHAAPRRSRN